MAKRPKFIGGPEDGKLLEERFSPGHLLHGKLPSGISIPTNGPPLPPGPKHTYEYIGGDYVYQGALTGQEEDDGDV